MDKKIAHLHRLFCAAAEAAKTVRVCERVLEALVLALAIAGVLLPETSQARLAFPALAVAAAVAAALSRWFSSHLRGYSEACRRLAVRGYALGDQHVSGKAVDDLIDAVPTAVSYFEKKLQILGIEDYYDVAVIPQGFSRLLAMYAASAYFTSRNLKRYAVMMVGAAIVVGAASLLAFYVAALWGPTLGVGALLKSIDVIAAVFIAGGLLILERGSDAQNAGGAVWEIESHLLDIDFWSPDEERLRALIGSYDAEHLAGPFIPSWVYWGRRDLMNQRLAERRTSVWKSWPPART